jgi:hypothetical protein
MSRNETVMKRAFVVFEPELALSKRLHKWHRKTGSAVDRNGTDDVFARDSRQDAWPGELAS